MIERSPTSRLANVGSSARQQLSSKIVAAGLLVSVVLFLGLTSPSSAADAVRGDSILCQQGGGGTVHYIVIGRSVLDGIEGLVINGHRPDPVPEDHCEFFMNSDEELFKSVARCGDSKIAQSLCARYGKRITRDDLPVATAWGPDFPNGYPGYDPNLDFGLDLDGVEYVKGVDGGCDLGYPGYSYASRMNVTNVIPVGNCEPVAVEY